MTNFKISGFKGSLKELLEECNPHFSDELITKSFNDAHSWLISQFEEVNENIYPVRKFKKFNSRGSKELFEKPNSYFMPVDNEPFCFFYAEWIKRNQFNGTIKKLLEDKNVPASWNCDSKNKNGMKFSGVSTAFRCDGLKLAHINDAGILEGIFQNSTSSSAIKIRFLRSLSPLNVFLFPNYRNCEIKSNYNSKSKDWAEDQKIRQIALSFLITKMKIKKELLDIFSPQFSILENWEELANDIKLEIFPKSIKREKVSSLKKIKVKIESNESTISALSACPKSGRTCSVADVVKTYIGWRKLNPDAIQLDGCNKNNPSKWLQFVVEGYTENDSFSSNQGPMFSGEDYNGVVNFHGDAKCEKIDEFVELYEQAESYRDVLVPYETQVRNGIVKPKFALKGYEDKVDGFYLYHDEWLSRQKKAS